MFLEAVRGQDLGCCGICALVGIYETREVGLSRMRRWRRVQDDDRATVRGSHRSRLPTFGGRRWWLMPQRTRYNANRRYLETDKTVVVVVTEKRWIGYLDLGRYCTVVWRM